MMVAHVVAERSVSGFVLCVAERLVKSETDGPFHMRLRVF